ncbi:hypothetical protein F9K33_11310 [bacterium]|nr:MAG: hypothetical protein F9K33_11310 [bacterium]
MYIGSEHGLIKLFLIIALSSSPVYSQSKETGKKDAPKWVNELPMSPGSIFAVGMVNRYFDKKAGEEAAAQSARAELAQTIKVNVKTITSTWSGSSASGLVSSLEKSIDEDVLASVQNAKILETWVDPEGLTYALAELPLAGAVSAIQKKVVDEAKKTAGKKDPKKIEKLEVSLKGLKDPKSYVRKDKPDWIKALPEEDDAIYAVGIAEGYYFYVNGREAAKDKSRGELGQTIKSEVQAILTDWYEVNSGEASGAAGQSFIEEMTNSVSEATLSGSQIVETWYDRSSKWHYALTRMSLSQVISHVNEKAKEKVKDPKKLKGLSDKLGKLINRDYLKMQNGYPVWINKIPKDKGAVFAVGMDEGKYFSQTKGIEKAKESARTKLAKTIGVQIENITKTWIESEGSSFGGEPLNDYMSEITKEATDVSLEGSQIMATFVATDKAGKQTFYALSRLYTGGMLAKIKRKASQTIKVPEATSQEDNAQKILSSGRESAKAALEKLNAALDQLD